jgi:hypothetical protein
MMDVHLDPLGVTIITRNMIDFRHDTSSQHNVVEYHYMVYQV